ncbi:hypothetical protein HDV05_000069 [Chytridiales sp. JEL 0842]|nr:hypothetical protein HDV05_000069 [Chytridiales sp. JEL 0842]
MAESAALPNAKPAEDGKNPTVILCIGMAGSGKTTFMQRLAAQVHTEKRRGYVVNLDPAVGQLPFGANIDIRDTVNYKEVMKQYNLGPNGGIVTSLNLFTTKFDQVLDIIAKRAPSLDYILFDTPGQIEIFTWSASGAIITDTLAATYPTVVAYIIDTPRSTSPVTFMSNMLYAVSILYKTRLPFVLVFNKTDVVSHEFAIEWMTDFEAFQAAVREDTTYMGTLVNSMCLVLEEFYNALKVVGVSAVTGAGMDDFFNAIDDAVDEYHADYKPEFERILREKKEKLEKTRLENLEKLMKDMKMSKGTEVDMTPKPDQGDQEEEEMKNWREGEAVDITLKSKEEDRSLEAATVKLEEIVKSKGSVDASVADAPAAHAQSSEQRASPSLAGFDDIINGSLKNFVDIASSIGSVVSEQAVAVQRAFAAQRAFIELAGASKKPDMASLPALLAPTQTEIQKILSLQEKSRSSPFFNHLSTVSEGIPALGWVAVEPTPGPFIGDMKDAAQFYANRVVKEYKDKDKTHVNLVQGFAAVLTDLQAYVKKHHTTGLTWNPKGGDAKAFSSSQPAAPAAAAPPPPPPLPKPETLAAFSADKEADKGALFSALNKGGLTSALKKVDKSEMTHKNPELRASGVVPATEKPAASPAPKFGGAATKAPPKLALEGNKWVVENYVNDTNVVIEGVELRHTVYIYNCTGSVIKVDGKVNAITLDNCKKSGLVLNSVVSTVDVVNSKSSQVQILGVAPTVVVDKTDGLQLFVSKASVEANIEIFTAKSSELNVLIEGEGEDGGFAERPVPEQFKTSIKGGKLVTTIVEHKG